MSKEYIDREAAIKWFMAFVHMGESDIPAETVIGDLKYAIPAADVAQVRYGRWKNEGMGDFRCSLCSYVASAAILNNFCPNCGARMDKEEE